MEKLLKKYREECDISSKLANTIWKIGQMLITLMTSLYCLKQRKVSIFILAVFAISILFLFIICEIINMRRIKKKLGLEKIVILKKEHKKTIYQELDIFQKKWINNYCKKNNLNTINKLEILKEEIRCRKNDKVKYINPIIIGTLLIPLWESIVSEVTKEIGVIQAIIPLLIFAFIVSFIVGEILKQFQFNNLFERYLGLERLEELLLFKIIKSNK